MPFLTFLIGGVSLSFEIPELNQLSKTVYVYKGGVSIIPELISLALALSMYILENVVFWYVVSRCVFVLMLKCGKLDLFDDTI